MNGSALNFSKKWTFHRPFVVVEKIARSLGRDDERLFGSLKLLATTIVILLALVTLVIVISNSGDRYIAPRTRNVFIGFFSIVILIRAAALALLANGMFRTARAIVAASVILSVVGVIGMTGGIWTSEATPTLLLPPTIFLCLYGARAGLAVAVALPVILTLQDRFFAVVGFAPPNLEPTIDPAFNRALVLVFTYVAAILALAVGAGLNAELRRRREAETRKLAHLANEDALTGIANARLFRERLDQACAKIDRRGGRLAVLYLDFDDFKKINDAFGHEIGDEALRLVASRLRGTVRREDTVARLGGDEFAVLVENVDDDRQISRLVERIRQVIAQPIEVGGARHTISTSVGQAFYPTDVSSRRSIVAFADRDMYRDKRETRSRKPSDA